jgi:PAS domain S-box-containing protein
MRLSTNFKLFIVCVGCLAFLTAIGATAYVATNRLVDTLSRVANTYEVLAGLESAFSDLTAAESAVRGYALTRENSFEQSYEGAVFRVQNDLRKLRVLTTGHETQQRNLDLLQSLVNQRIDLLKEYVSFFASGDRRALVAGGIAHKGSQLTEAVRRVVDQMATEENRLRKETSQAAESSAYMARVIAVAASIIGAVFVIGSALLIRRDVCRREESERALRLAERKIRGIFENSPFGIFDSSIDGRFLAVNAAMASILGYDSTEDLLYHHNELRTPLYANPETRRELVRMLHQTGVVRNYVSELSKKDGSTVWVTGCGRVVEDEPGERHFEGLVHDITERKLAQEQLANVKTQLESVLNSATRVSIISTDVNGTITMFNPGAERMLGYSAAEMIGKTPEIFHFAPEVEERCREMSLRLGRQVTGMHVFILGALEGADDVTECTYVRKDGRHLTVSLAITGIRNVQGELVGFLGISTDITDLKRTECERIRLEQQLRRKNIELERETRRALEASRMKSEFLANMSHELRTPLNGIIGFTEIMHDELIGPVSDEHKEFLADILKSARHLLQLINDILDLSKIEAGRMEFQPEDTDLATVIGEVRDILKSLSEKKTLHFESDLDPRVNQIHLDPRKLKQVLYNYLSNAIKFTPEGGTIRVRTHYESAEMFRVEVEDTGIGIKPDDLKHLFKEFQQLDASASKRYQGTGLGLALTKRIVETQGGQVGITSTPGKGSTFYALLPRTGVPITSELTADLAHIAQPDAGRSADYEQPEEPGMELVTNLVLTSETHGSRIDTDR